MTPPKLVAYLGQILAAFIASSNYLVGENPLVSPISQISYLSNVKQDDSL